MKNLTILLLLSLLSLFFMGCFKQHCFNYYAFDFPITVTPQDTFNIGDTIWYEMNVPNQILDKNSGEFIDFTDYELHFDISI